MHMNWDEVKLDSNKVYPKNSITVFMMDTESGQPATHWVDKAYENYEFKQECMFNCYVTIDFENAFNSQKKDFDIAEIEQYFANSLREVCICHIVARTTTDNGINIELYVDDVEEAIQKLNVLGDHPNRLVDFDCEIIEDENWDNVAVLFD